MKFSAKCVTINRLAFSTTTTKKIEKAGKLLQGTASGQYAHGPVTNTWANATTTNKENRLDSLSYANFRSGWAEALQRRISFRLKVFSNRSAFL